jgi:hypothetical protein
MTNAAYATGPEKTKHDDSQWHHWTDLRTPWQEHKSFLRWIILEADAETYLKPYNDHAPNGEPERLPLMK